MKGVFFVMLGVVMDFCRGILLFNYKFLNYALYSKKKKLLHTRERTLQANSIEFGIQILPKLYSIEVEEKAADFFRLQDPNFAQSSPNRSRGRQTFLILESKIFSIFMKWRR